MSNYGALCRDEHDRQLTDLARQHNHAVGNWWGERVYGGYPGARLAVCYLCAAEGKDRYRTIIATWSRRWPRTKAADEAVAEHRQEHLDALVNRS